MIVGDVNYHFDSSFQPQSLFKKLTESIGLHQHINCPTHVSGNILDLIFTHSDIPLQFVSSCTRSDLLTEYYLNRRLRQPKWISIVFPYVTGSY